MAKESDFQGGVRVISRDYTAVLAMTKLELASRAGGTLTRISKTVILYRCLLSNMSATDLLHEIEALPQDERLWLVERLSALADDDVPESFRQSFAEAQRGEVIDLDSALQDLEAE